MDGGGRLGSVVVVGNHEHFGGGYAFIGLGGGRTGGGIGGGAIGGGRRCLSSAIGLLAVDTRCITIGGCRSDLIVYRYHCGACKFSCAMTPETGRKIRAVEVACDRLVADLCALDPASDVLIGEPLPMYDDSWWWKIPRRMRGNL